MVYLWRRDVPRNSCDASVYIGTTVVHGIVYYIQRGGFV